MPLESLRITRNRPFEIADDAIGKALYFRGKPTFVTLVRDETVAKYVVDILNTVHTAVYEKPQEEGLSVNVNDQITQIDRIA
jgi:hypothetical protein